MSSKRARRRRKRKRAQAASRRAQDWAQARAEKDWSGEEPEPGPPKILPPLPGQDPGARRRELQAQARRAARVARGPGFSPLPVARSRLVPSRTLEETEAYWERRYGMDEDEEEEG